MTTFYILEIDSISEEYIVPQLSENLIRLKSSFYRDERWYIDSDPETICLDPDNGGVEIPDALVTKELIFFSDRLRAFLDQEGADYIFYKKIIISDEILGIEEPFNLACIPRIDCVDFSRSGITNADEYDYNDGIVPFYNMNSPVIIPEQCGRYKIFRILGSACNRIFLLDSLCEKLSAAGFTGMRFRKLKNN